ncbi:MAG TPA: nuclear transport factor 2 family protein [Usitatibacter sp.]|nr:nuclear transport factor 2 family protein [Usitatibacter sp.]
MRTCLVLALLTAGCAALPPPGTEDPASLAAAETAFAAQSVKEDMRTAFLANFAPDGMYVRKEWTNARQDLAGRAAPPVVLDWRPVHTEVAASGEMGLSTGPWKLTSKTDPAQPPTYGQFVSIWKREAGGPWKVAVDIGVSNPKNSLWETPLDLTPSAAPGALDPVGGAEDADGLFQLTANFTGMAAAYRMNVGTRMRFYREGIDPLVTRESALDSPALASRDLFFFYVEKAEVAKSGDFGYVRGHYVKYFDPEKVLGQFLRVWRLENGHWRIVLDVATSQ